LTGSEIPSNLKWVSCFALSVNEVNAALGRIVTAPTNGKASNSICFNVLVVSKITMRVQRNQAVPAAGEIGSNIQKGVVPIISAAMGVRR
jgi:L-serine dehydratase